MSCEGCKITANGTGQALEAAKQAAFNYGKEKSIKHMAIWKEGPEFFFGEAGSAFASGKPVSEVLSVYPTSTT